MPRIPGHLCKQGLGDRFAQPLQSDHVQRLMKRMLIELRRRGHRIGIVEPAIGGRLTKSQQGDRHLRTPTHIRPSAVTRPLGLDGVLDLGNGRRTLLASRHQRQSPIQLRTQTALHQISPVTIDVVGRLLGLGGIVGRSRRLSCLGGGRRHPHCTHHQCSGHHRAHHTLARRHCFYCHGHSSILERSERSRGQHRRSMRR